MRKIMRTVVIGATLLLSPCVMAGSDGVEHAIDLPPRLDTTLS